MIPSSEAQQALSAGAERVQSHNPLTDRQKNEMEQVKGVVAALIDNLEFLVQGGGSRARAARIAQERFEEAQMWAVRAISKPHSK